MSKYEEKPCDCGNHFIENRTYWKCSDCNYYRIHSKTRIEVQIEKQKGKKVKVYELKRTPLKRSQKPLKRSRIKMKSDRLEKRREVLKKDREVYYKVFESKPNICEECGGNLPSIFEDEEGNIIAIYRFSHILSKAAYPEFRHNEKNFNMLCLKCHQIWDFGDKKNMKIYEPNQLIIQKIKNDE